MDNPSPETKPSPVPQSPTLPSPYRTIPADPKNAMPEKIGHYHIKNVLGKGGMGIVYHAERRDEVRMEVAIKVIRASRDLGDVIARFEGERQAMALLNHPYIAHAIDAGTTDDNQPYFVMEYVPGVPITQYCDMHRLTNPQRLVLFSKVCDAVQHAHDRGLIHRDLKPSNILVMLQDGQPIPKIIDFGVAKATNQRLTEKTIFTEFGQLIGTPEYMSPEQAEMSTLDVDKLTDIYSLGVILYELLVGTLPFDSKTLRRAGFLEIQRIIREVDPPKPSTRLSTVDDDTTTIAEKRQLDLRALQRELRGDLDWITMKAMEKDRTRRYDSARAFSQDIDRYLRHQPVLARPPELVYRLRKYVRRRKAMTALVASSVVAIIALWFGFSQSRTRLQQAGAAQIQQSAILASEALALMQIPKNSEAMTKLKEAISLDPQNDDAWHSLATLKRAEFEATRDPAIYNEAIAALDKIIALQPKLAEPLNTKGVFMRLAGKPLDSVPVFKKAIDLDRNYGPAYVSLANSFIQLRDWDSAEKYLTQADALPVLETDDRPWQRWHNFAALRLALDRPDADTAIKKSLSNKGNTQPDVWLLSARIHLISASSLDPVDALADLDRARLDPEKTSWKTYRYSALAKLKLHRDAEAITDAQRAIDLKDPLPAYPLFIKAIALAKSDPAAARAAADAAGKAWPQTLENNQIEATIDLGLPWFETYRELKAIRQQAEEAIKGS